MEGVIVNGEVIPTQSQENTSKIQCSVCEEKYDNVTELALWSFRGPSDQHILSHHIIISQTWISLFFNYSVSSHWILTKSHTQTEGGHEGVMA